MKSRVLFCSLVLSSIALAACGGHDDAPPPFASDLGSRLEADTGVAWDLARGPGGEVRSMLPEKPVRIGGAPPQEAAKQFFTKYATALGGTGGAELDPLTTPDDDLDGLRYVTFAHIAPASGIPVFDTATFAAFTPTGELLYAQADFHSGVDAVPSKASISKTEAATLAKRAVETECGAEGASGEQTVQLGISAVAAPRLVYRVRTTAEYESCHSPLATVDAVTGELVSVADGATNATDPAARGVHYFSKNNKSDVKPIQFSMKDGKPVLEAPATRGTSEQWLPQISTRAWKGTAIEADITSTIPNEWEPEATYKGVAVDAHYHVGRGLDFFRTVLRRRGLDNTGTGDVLVIVHDNSRTRSAWSRARASSYKRANAEVISIGDGVPGTSLPAAAYDVLVHELAHGITRNTSRLAYQGESGALDEAFADVMAASAELWIAGQPEKLPIPTKPTVIGENVTTNGVGLRDLQDPQAHDQPDHYSNLLPCPPGSPPSDSNDKCWVHTNSGIANRAWSLMALGGVHPLSGVKVPAIGWERAALLWYNTVTRLGPQATMLDAAKAMVARATLSGADAVISTACAWHAVGVGDFKVSSFTTNMCAKLVAAPVRVSTSTCNGVAFGYVCQEGAPNAAYVCTNGSIASGVLCSNKAQRCKKRAPNDWTATYDLLNGLSCE